MIQFFAKIKYLAMQILMTSYISMQSHLAFTTRFNFSKTWLHEAWMISGEILSQQLLNLAFSDITLWWEDEYELLPKIPQITKPIGSKSGERGGHKSILQNPDISTCTNLEQRLRYEMWLRLLESDASFIKQPIDL